MKENERFTIYSDENGPKLIVEQLPDKKLPQLFVEQNGIVELIATFQSSDKAEKFVKALGEIVNA